MGNHRGVDKSLSVKADGIRIAEVAEYVLRQRPGIILRKAHHIGFVKPRQGKPALDGQGIPGQGVRPVDAVSEQVAEGSVQKFRGRICPVALPDKEEDLFVKDLLPAKQGGKPHGDIPCQTVLPGSPGQNAEGKGIEFFDEQWVLFQDRQGFHI